MTHSDPNSTPQKPGASRKRMLMLVVAGGLTGLYAYFFAIPIQTSSSQIRGEIEQQQAFIESAETIEKDLDRLTSKYDALQQITSRWQGDAPHFDNIAPLLGKLTQDANRFEVDVIRLEQHQVIQKESIADVRVLFVGEGSFRNIFDFVNSVDQLKASIWLEHVQLSTENSGRLNPENIQCEMTLRIFADNFGYSR